MHLRGNWKFLSPNFSQLRRTFGITKAIHENSVGPISRGSHSNPVLAEIEVVLLTVTQRNSVEYLTTYK